MKRFLSTTAILVALTGAAHADTMASGFGTTKAEMTDFYASDLIGMRIYSSQNEYDVDTRIAAGTQNEWEDIGEINDIILTEAGDVRAVILGVGGFLGIGERDVSVSMDAIKVLYEDGDSNERFLVVNTTKEALEQAPAYERTMAQEMAAEVEETETEMEQTAEAAEAEVEQVAENAEAEVEQTAEAVEAETEQMTETAEAEAIDEVREPLVRPTVEREGYQEADMETVQAMTAEDIQGSYVYGANDETVGEVDSLIMDDSGKVSEVVINVGGFLGLGEKPVAVTFDELQILKNVEGDDFRIYIDSTEERLEQLPEHKG